MSVTLCTLFEGDYHLGAAALLNSLHQSGFRGDFICGYRGARPAWANDSVRLAPITLHWIEVSTPVHFTNYKPTFMLECFQKHTPHATAVGYLDPDIVVKAPWPVLERWFNAPGVALCEDINPSLPSGHPYRLTWQNFFERHSLEPVRSLERYYNAGFIALSRHYTDLLVCWTAVLNLAAKELGSLEQLKQGSPNDLFHTVDQDALNMALLLYPAPINSAGPESMDFVPGGHLLSHAAGGPKPWRGGFLRASLAARPPSTAQKQFYRFVESPLPVFSSGLLAWRRFELHAAAFLGRFYHRT
jgi:hypothetical protein